MNKFTLISGSSSGIGLGTAIEISKTSRVIVNGIESELELEKILLTLHEPAKHLVWSLDFKNPENIYDSLSSLLSDNDAVVDTFIHSAGIAPIMAQKNCSYNMMLNLFNVNFFSASEIVRVLLKKKINKKTLKNILFVSALFSQYGAKGHSQYGATKAALNGFMKSLAVELAPEIRVNSIMPGAIYTPMAEQVLKDDVIRAQLEYTYLLGIGQIEDVVNLICFLISNKAKWITGQNYIIDGGRTTNLNQK